MMRGALSAGDGPSGSETIAERPATACGARRCTLPPSYKRPRGILTSLHALAACSDCSLRSFLTPRTGNNDHLCRSPECLRQPTPSPSRRVVLTHPMRPLLPHLILTRKMLVSAISLPSPMKCSRWNASTLRENLKWTTRRRWNGTRSSSCRHSANVRRG